MASKPVIKYTCDRCGKDYEEEPAPGSEKKVKNAVFMLEAHVKNADASPQRITFEDLCTKCDKRVGDLIRAIALPDKAAGDQSSESTTLDGGAKPSDNKGSKDAGKAPTNPS